MESSDFSLVLHTLQIRHRRCRLHHFLCADGREEGIVHLIGVEQDIVAIEMTKSLDYISIILHHHSGCLESLGCRWRKFHLIYI